MCGATTDGPSLVGVDLAKETVIQGVVTRDGEPVPAAYVRLLDATGQFTAEVVASATGQFRFFAKPGSWTVRVIPGGGHQGGEAKVDAAEGEISEVRISV